MKIISFLAVGVFLGGTAQAQSGRILQVDRRGGAEFSSLRQAAQKAQPGDTIKIAPGSGPYREVLMIKASGQPGAPITVDGSGETVTGFEPLTGFEKVGDEYVCDLKPWFQRIPAVQGFVKKDGVWLSNNPRVTLPVLPTVLAYQGERVLQDARTGELTKYARFSPEAGTLTLLPGVSPEGWEVALRQPVVQVTNASYQTFRNLKATGSLNDGFNLHGSGTNLLFENVEGYNNMDEGFSAHDEIECEVRDSAFWRNDNGIAQGTNFKASNLKIYSNLGWGLSFGDEKKVELTNVQVWNNGVTQMILRPGVELSGSEVRLYEAPWSTKPWLNYQESSSRDEATTYVVETKNPVADGVVEVLPAEQAPSLEAEHP